MFFRRAGATAPFPPLLEKERHPGALALVAQAAGPFRGHRARAAAPFAADDPPLGHVVQVAYVAPPPWGAFFVLDDVEPRAQIDRAEQGLQAQEPLCRW